MAQRQLENYEKKPKSIKEQIALLKSRNLLFENEFRAEVILKNISYNRLSNYWYPLLKEPKEDEIFKAGSPFISAFRLYQFDSEFRKITFHAIEQIEIAVRTQIIYQLSHKYGTGFWFEKHEAFNHYSNYLKVLNKIASRCDETNQEYILKYKLKYKQYNPPAWKSFELLTFNELLLILKSVSDFKDLIPIASHFGLHHTVLISWIESFVYIRNICAHHGRLWNRKLIISPKWPKRTIHPWIGRWENEEKNDYTKDKVLKVYATICMIIYVMNSINPYNSYKTDLLELSSRFKLVDLRHMGFPNDWHLQPLWN